MHTPISLGTKPVGWTRLYRCRFGVTVSPTATGLIAKIGIVLSLVDR